MANKSSKPGAVKYFNDKKAEAFKSAANAMKAFKKNMPKAELGQEMETNDLSRKQKKGIKSAEKTREKHLDVINKQSSSNTQLEKNKDLVNKKADSTINSIKLGTIIPRRGVAAFYNPGSRTQKKGGVIKTKKNK